MIDLRARYASSPQSVARARRAIVDFARVAGLTGDAPSDVQLAVGEALANAAEHAALGGATRFDVHAFVEGDALVIEVRDNGRGFDVSKHSRAAARETDRLRGYGTFIMRAVMDRVEYTSGGTCVRLVKRFADADYGSLEEER